MKTTKLFYTIFLAGISVILAGCSEDFLEQRPKTQETEEMFFGNFENVETAVTAAYSRLCFLGYDLASTINPNCLSDDIEAGGENAADGINWKQIDQIAHDAGNPAVRDNWRVNYKGIRLANVAIHYLEQLIINGDKTDPALIRQRIAECRFLRAYYHFELVKFFGGAPIVTHVLDPEEFYPERSSIAAVMHYVELELEEAIPHLPVRSQQGGEFGRVSKGAAQALLARAYLYESSYSKYWPGDDRFGPCENKFQKALEMAEAVISSNEYELVGINGERFDSWWGKTANGTGNKTFDGKTNAFRWIFSVGGDNSKESVFEVQNTMDGKGWGPSRGNALTIFTVCRYTDQTPTISYGWGFNCPSPYLLAAFANADTRETDLSPENKERILEYSDPRYFTTVGKSGTEILIRKELKTTGDLVWARMKLDNVPAGTISRKYEPSPDESILNPQRVANESGPINWKLVRYSDVILIAAEAAYESGNKDKALQYVNMVRKRARLSSDNPAGNVYPKDLSSITFGDIVHERRIEFAGEQFRFFDLVRWNLAEQYINNSELAMMPGTKLKFQKGKHEFFPIPIEQIQLSLGTLVQYDPWK